MQGFTRVFELKYGFRLLAVFGLRGIFVACEIKRVELKADGPSNDEYLPLDCGSGFPAAITIVGMPFVRGWKAAPTIKTAMLE